MKVTDKNYYMDDSLRANLDILKKAVSRNWDGIIMIDGIEGSAKTTLAGSIAYYLNNRYSLNSVVFTQEQFTQAVDNARAMEVIHWDEFIFGGLSTEALNKVQNELIKKMTTIRKKQLFIILLMPWFFMMRPYFAIGRSRCLIHCYTPDGITRGLFKFYSYDNKQKLYHWGKKDYNYRKTKENFTGRFTDTYGLFWDTLEYDKKKEKAIKEISKDKSETMANRLNRLFPLVAYCHRDLKMTYEKLSKVTKVPPATLRHWHLIHNNMRNE